MLRHLLLTRVVFEHDFHTALNDAATSFDTRPLEQLLTRWWPTAAARSIHLTEAEQDQMKRVRFDAAPV